MWNFLRLIVTAIGLFTVTLLIRSEGQVRPQFFITPTIFGVLNCLWAWPHIGRARLLRACAFVLLMSPVWLGVVSLTAHVGLLGIATGGCIVALCEALLFGSSLRMGLFLAAMLFMAWLLFVTVLKAAFGAAWVDYDPMGVATWQAIYLTLFSSWRPGLLAARERPPAQAAV